MRRAEAEFEPSVGSVAAYCSGFVAAPCKFGLVVFAVSVGNIESGVRKEASGRTAATLPIKGKG